MSGKNKKMVEIKTYAQLPDPGFVIDKSTAIVITDPQNDFLSPDGVTWGVVGESVTKNGTVDNLETIQHDCKSLRFHPPNYKSTIDYASNY